MGKDEKKKTSSEAKPAVSQEELVAEFLANSEDFVLSGAPLKHGRSLPLPLRVKSGAIKKDMLIAETAQERYEIPWEKIQVVCLGFVAERYETDKAAYATEKIISDVGRMVAGGSQEEGKIVSFKESQVLDVCAEGFAEPLRFESGNLNYRAFLERMSYVSFQNFFRFVREFVSHCRQARFNANVKHFLSWQRYDLHRCAAFYEHDEFVAQNWLDPSKLLEFGELDLSRTEWAQEWTE